MPSSKRHSLNSHPDSLVPESKFLNTKLTCGYKKGPIFINIKILASSVSPSHNSSTYTGLLAVCSILGKKISTDLPYIKRHIEGALKYVPPKPHRKSKRRSEAPDDSPGLKCLNLHAIMLLSNHFWHSNVLCKKSWNPSSIVKEQTSLISSSTDQRKFQPLCPHPSHCTPSPPPSVNPLQMRVCTQTADHKRQQLPVTGSIFSI